MRKKLTMWNVIIGKKSDFKMIRKDEEKSKNSEIIDEYNEIIEKIKSQPGVEDLYIVTGYYETLKQSLDFYLEINQKRNFIISSNSTD